MQGIIIQMRYECALMRTDEFLFLQTQKKGCVHEAASKDLPSLWEMKSMLAGCSTSHHFNMFSCNSKQIWRVNKFTSAFLQSQNFKVKQSQK